MMMQRRVEPEWLDELAPDNPDAIRSRRDLRRINALMANGYVIRCELAEHLDQTRYAAIAEIGAGEGTLMLRLAEALSGRWPDADVTLVDRQSVVGPATLAGLRSTGWCATCVEADVFAWAEQPAAGTFDAIIANLFLHHFEPDKLSALLAKIARRTRLFIACEPRRSKLALAGSQLLGMIGCNHVTRHDAVISVRAGFSGNELSDLWPKDGSWSTVERQCGLFGHCFTAIRLNQSGVDDVANTP